MGSGEWGSGEWGSGEWGDGEWGVGSGEWGVESGEWGYEKPSWNVGGHAMENEEISSYRDLRVWQAGMKLAEQCYHLTRGFPKEEMFGMTSQIRRAGTSIPANIAEGYGRENRGEYIQFLKIAQGSLKELETHLLLAERCQIAGSQLTGPILGECESLGKMLRTLIRRLQAKRSGAGSGGRGEEGVGEEGRREWGRRE